MGIEPTHQLVTGATGFEDQEAHQAPWHFHINNVFNIGFIVNQLVK